MIPYKDAAAKLTELGYQLHEAVPFKTLPGRVEYWGRPLDPGIDRDGTRRLQERDDGFRSPVVLVVKDKGRGRTEAGLGILRLPRSCHGLSAMCTEGDNYVSLIHGGEHAKKALASHLEFLERFCSDPDFFPQMRKP